MITLLLGFFGGVGLIEMGCIGVVILVVAIAVIVPIAAASSKRNRRQ